MEDRGTQNSIFPTLIQCAQAFSPGSPIKLSGERASQEWERIENDQQYLDQIAHILLEKSGINDLHDWLWQFALNVKKPNRIGIRYALEILLGTILNILSCKDREAFLSKLLTSDNRYFWNYIIALSEIMCKFEFTADFLIDWLPKVAKREGNDMAGGNAYRIALKYAQCYPQVALGVVENYINNDYEDIKGTIVQESLGGLRVSPKLTKEQKTKLDIIENTLQEHESMEWRACLCRSWGATISLMPFELNFLLEKLSLYDTGSIEEKTARFYVMRRWMLSFLNGENSGIVVKTFLDWHKKHANCDITNPAKYNLLLSLQGLLLKQDVFIVNVNTSSDLLYILSNVLPIETENRDEWSILIELMGQLASHLSPTDWVRLWGLIVGKDDKSTNFNEIYYNIDPTFCYPISQVNMGEIISVMLFHENGRIRFYGQVFWNEIPEVKLDQVYIKAISEERFLLGVLYFASNVRFNSVIWPFVKSIAPRLATMKQTDENFTLIIDNLRVLAIDYPGAMIEGTEGLLKEFPVLNKPINEAKDYFRGLQKYRLSPINQITRYELSEADSVVAKYRQSYIQKAVFERSLFGLIGAKRTNIIYGDGASCIINRKLSDRTPRETLTSSNEIPRLPMIIPEEEILRKVENREKCTELEENLSSDSATQ